MLEQNKYLVQRSFNSMEDWQLEFEWLRVRHHVKEALGRTDLPDLQIILLLIGIQEVNVFKDIYTKEEKQDLMHVATCQLLSQDGFYAFTGKDDEGWPHYEQIRVIPIEGVDAQERLLKENVIKYFKNEIKLVAEPNAS